MVTRITASVFQFHERALKTQPWSFLPSFQYLQTCIESDKCTRTRLCFFMKCYENVSFLEPIDTAFTLDLCKEISQLFHSVSPLFFLCRVFEPHGQVRLGMVSALLFFKQIFFDTRHIGFKRIPLFHCVPLFKCCADASPVCGG